MADAEETARPVGLVIRESHSTHVQRILTQCGESTFCFAHLAPIEPDPGLVYLHPVTLVRRPVRIDQLLPQVDCPFSLVGKADT